MLSYDFEMYPVNEVPCATTLDTGRRISRQLHASSNKVIAFFRDPKTNDVITSAPPIVRVFLEEAGFALADAEQLAVENKSAEPDADLRRVLAAQLTEALSNRALKKALARAADQSEFDLAEFISAVVAKKKQADKSEETATPLNVSPRRPSQLRAERRTSRNLNAG